MSRASLVLIENFCLFLCLYYDSYCCCMIQLPGLHMNAEKEVTETLTMSALSCKIDTLNCKTLLNHFQLLLLDTLRVILRKAAGKKPSTFQF